jgi:16S rRNA (cytosine1402-N4)-methyltransferase
MPLDMRIDESLETTAADIVNELDEKSLADLIFQYGQDRASRRIARYIVERRRREPLRTTGQLAAVVCSALRAPNRKYQPRKHPATRTFQALRIAVNHELENLQELLASAPGLLRKDGFVAVISYHSLEDGLVKRDFKRNADEGVYRLRTKKPIVPSEPEIAANHRARSAKLRIAQKT